MSKETSGGETDIRAIFPSNSFLKYNDLVGTSWETVILSAKAEEVDAPWGRDHRIVLDLEPHPDNVGMPTKVSASKRLAREIAEAAGTPDFAKWPGRLVEFFGKEVQAFGKVHQVIGCKRSEGGL